MAATQHDRVVVDVDGCPVAWRCCGDGPPLVLLHGGHGSWEHWTRNLAPLARTRRLLVPDMPGYGDSGMPAQADLPGLVEVLARALAALPERGDGPIDLVGFSFGGLVAAQLASHPALGRAPASLALLGPAGHGGPRRLVHELADWRRCADEASLAAVMRANLAALMFAEPAAIDDAALALHTRACRATRFRSKPISRAGGLQAALARYAGPVLLAWGEHDVTVTPEAIDGIARAARAPSAPAARVEVVAGAGHWVQYEAHARVNALLQDWLARPQAGPARSG